jgi:hypothetical protein
MNAIWFNGVIVDLVSAIVVPFPVPMLSVRNSHLTNKATIAPRDHKNVSEWNALWRFFYRPPPLRL